jgi:hypothetical protein
MSYVNHIYAWGLAKRFMGSERMKMGRIYLMSTKEYKQEAFCDGRKLIVKLFGVLTIVWSIWIKGVIIK